MKSVRLLNDPYTNVISVITLTIVSYILILSMNLDGGKTNEIITLFYPSFIALATLLVYLVSRLCFKKFNWIITFAGTIYMFYISIINWNLY